MPPVIAQLALDRVRSGAQAAHPAIEMPHGDAGELQASQALGVQQQYIVGGLAAALLILTVGILGVCWARRQQSNVRALTAADCLEEVEEEDEMPDRSRKGRQQRSKGGQPKRGQKSKSKRASSSGRMQYQQVAADEDDD